MKKAPIFKLTAAAICIVLSALCLFACGKNTDDDIAVSGNEPTNAATPTNINPLTGIGDLDSGAIGKRPVCVMVENSPQARPQWGLCSPDIVMEGEVEGGITRMLWVYSDISKAPKIGPCRSARHDYVELAEGLDAIYVHFGGSPMAYEKISADKVNDIDGMTSGSYFGRDESRKVASEHTAYTTGEKLVKAIEAKGYRTDLDSAYASPFSFAAEKRTLSGGACNSILAVFSSAYKHTFKYNTEDNLYYNYMNTSEMKDADGNTMAVTNVIVLYTNISNMNTGKGHVDWDLTEGSGVYVSNGTYENITWSKGGASKMLELKDANGNTLQLNPGKSWIGFVKSSNQSSTVIS